MPDINDNPFNQYNFSEISHNEDESKRVRALIYSLIKKRFITLDGLKAATVMFQSNVDEAKLLNILDQICQRDPEDSSSIAALARLQLSLGQPKAALMLIAKGLSTNLDNQHYWSLFSRCIQLLDITAYQPALIELYEKMLYQPAVNPKNVSSAIMRALHWHPLWQRSLDLIEGSVNDLSTTIELIETLSENKLFIELIRTSTVTSIDAEMVLTHARRRILYYKSSISKVENSLVLLCAIAEQCFFNEFVYSISREERQLIKGLEQEICNLWEMNGSPPLILIAILGCYRPLYNYAWSKKLLERKYNKFFSSLITTTIKNHLDELEIKSTIHTLQLTSDDVSRKVKAQYEDNPYPRWKSGGFLPNRTTIREALNPYAIDTTNITINWHPSILIAGCGTGHQVLQTASRFLYSNITAIDLSKSSLAYAIRKTRELGHSDIQYVQSDILCVADLETQFDIIECRGVLHHMKEPFVGLKALTMVLKPNGVMRLGLYSKLARAPIAEERRKTKNITKNYSDEKIRKYRQLIFQQATKNENGVTVHNNPIVSKDFFSMSECRDLLFHSKEHRLNLLQIAKALGDLKLNFLGFEIPAQIRKQFLSTRSETSDLYSLSAWHEYETENPNTFAQMYEFWVQKT